MRDETIAIYVDCQLNCTVPVKVPINHNVAHDSSMGTLLRYAQTGIR
jgi:hypothetical protein